MKEREKDKKKIQQKKIDTEGSYTDANQCVWDITNPLNTQPLDDVDTEHNNNNKRRKKIAAIRI